MSSNTIIISRGRGPGCQGSDVEKPARENSAVKEDLIAAISGSQTAFRNLTLIIRQHMHNMRMI